MNTQLKNILSTSLLAFALAFTLLPADAGAVCANTVETDEQTIWNRHNCWTAFRDWFRPYFNLQSSHWSGSWGWDSCNPTQAFPKMWNSAYLITYGLTGSGSWHNDVDYYKWASGNNHGFRYEPEDSTAAFARAFAGWFVTDRAEMMCPSFNNRMAGLRAGTMLHEATHIQFGGFSGPWGHQSNPPGSNCSDDCSDDWYFHNQNDYSHGFLAGRRHSMNQIQIEYLCDLSEFGEWWVPSQTETAARSEANMRMTNRIRNPPGWTCGNPRPTYTPPPWDPGDDPCGNPNGPCL